MTFPQTLRFRIVVGFVVFGLILSVTLAAVIYIGFHRIEDFVVKDAMQAEIDLAHESRTNSTQRRAPIATMTIYSTSRLNFQNLPEQLRALAPGYHRLIHEGHQYLVLVDDRDEQRYIISYDETPFVRRSQYWLIGLVGSVVLALAISLWVGYSLAGRVIRPVTKLTADIRALESNPDAALDLASYGDDEVGSLSRAFQDYRDRFKSLMDREREFASNVSHELRTPVTSINLAVEVLAEDTTISEKQRFRLQRIQRAGREMSEMINTFLLLSRYEGEGDAELADCDVNRTVREIVEDQSVWIDDKPVSTEVMEEAQLTVQAPRGVVAVLIGNVVRNAYRYTRHGLITVRITEDRVIVEDTGPGIDTQTQAHLFDRHVRGASSDHGTGLGLSIVKRLCERYGWRVEVTSTLGIGSRFDIVMRHV